MVVDESGTFITSTVFDSSSEFDIPFELRIYKTANRIDNKNQMRPNHLEHSPTLLLSSIRER